MIPFAIPFVFPFPFSLSLDLDREGNSMFQEGIDELFEVLRELLDDRW